MRYKFRVWNNKNNEMYYVTKEAELQLNFGINDGWALWEAYGEMCDHTEGELMQWTGLTDRNGKEIYEGDVLRVRRPGRDQQTHCGDNIPLGSYTEPLEPMIHEYTTTVKFDLGMFGCEVEDEDHLPLNWVFVDTTAKDEDELKEMFSGGWGSRIFESWEDDLEYLFEEYKVSSVEELINYIGVEVIGNIYENPELINS